MVIVVVEVTVSLLWPGDEAPAVCIQPCISYSVRVYGKDKTMSLLLDISETSRRELSFMLSVEIERYEMLDISRRYLDLLRHSYA